MTNIALMGKARSGKDTVAARLCEAHGYARVAFADPLKEHALRINPIVSTRFSGGDEFALRLARCVEIYGWERAKDEFPEVRRTLQEIGQGVREVDPYFWVRIAVNKISEVRPDPVVVTDVRYPNEVATLRAIGFRIVRIVRPVIAANLTPAEREAAKHDSETALDGETPDVLIYNGGSLAELAQRADALTT
jgi:hypothetical protein